MEGHDRRHHLWNENDDEVKKKQCGLNNCNLLAASDIHALWRERCAVDVQAAQ